MRKGAGQRLGCTGAGDRLAPAPGNCAEHLCRPPSQPPSSLHPSSETLPFPPPIHLATLWPLLQPEQAEGDRWREGCRQRGEGCVFSRVEETGVPVRKEWGRTAGERGALWSGFPKDPSHPKLPPSCTSSVLLYRVLTRGPGLHHVLGRGRCREIPNKTQSLATRSFHSWQESQVVLIKEGG